MRQRLPTAPPCRILLAVAIVTCGALVSETLQAVTLSLQVFSHNAFLVVSIAMLGLGCGGSLAAVLGARRPATRPEALIYGCMMLFAGTLATAGVLASRATSLEFLILLGLAPYIPVGALLAVLFAAWPGAVGRSYSADLVGSAVGCAALAGLLAVTGSPGKVILLTAAAGFAAAAVVGFPLSARKGVLALALAAGVLALLPFDLVLFRYRPSPLKHYGWILADPAIETTREWSRWGYLGRLDVVRPGRGIERFAPGAFARRTLDRGDDLRFLFASGDNWSYALCFADSRHAVEFGRTSVASAPYAVVGPRPDVLVIGVGGGVDVFTAVLHDARSVTAVEINPLMVRAARGLGPAWWNGALFDRRVRFVEMDGRTFADTSRESYDVITLTAVDTGAAFAHGGFVLSENYLYTAEAWDRYLSILKPGGVVFVMRPLVDVAKLSVSAGSALRRAGADRPEEHVAVLGSEFWRGMLVFRDAIDTRSRGRLLDALRLGLADGALTYAPGLAFPGLALEPLFARMTTEGPGALAADPVLRTTTDDWPFFYQREPSLVNSMAGRIVGRVLLIVTLAGVALVAAPLAALRRRAADGTTSVGSPARRRAAVLGYFAAIGLGFMFAEIALIQKLALLLGDPVYSLTVTLLVLLLSTGLGSLLAGASLDRGSRRVRFAPLGAAVLLGALASALPSLLRLGTVPSPVARLAWAAVLVAPLGAVLGAAFPLGVRELADEPWAAVPWAWAINAIASVVGAALAVGVALGGGYSLVLALAATAYVAAFFALAALRKTSGGAT